MNEKELTLLGKDRNKIAKALAGKVRKAHFALLKEEEGILATHGLEVRLTKSTEWERRQ